MSFQKTAAKSSRINKPAARRKPLFATAKRRTSSAESKLNEAVQDHAEEHQGAYHGSLEDPRIIRARLAPGMNSSSIEDIMIYFQRSMFSDIRIRAPGMNSTRISEVLNYRLNLPPIVPVAHVHALRASPTSTEREIAAKVQSGVLRKVTIPRRGQGSDSFGEGLVLVTEWEKAVQAVSGLPNSIKEKFILHLKSRPTSVFTPNELKSLLQAGLVTGKSTSSSVSDIFLQPGSASLGTLIHVAESGSRHASGSGAASAASAIEHTSGGARPLNTGQVQQSQLPYNLSLPNTGPFLRLLSNARAHLLSLLTKSGPYKSMPLERLHERWEGGATELGDQDDFEGLGRIEKRGVLPGRTKKWKEFYGLRFEWVLAESVGAGLVECFRTGSIGTGVRVV
jgi:hypothetical protein